MKKTLACIVMVLMIMFLVGISLDKAISKATAKKPKRGGVLVYAIHYEPPHWDIHLTLSYRSQVYGSFVYSKLTREKQGEGVDPYEFTPIPDLAESWEYLSPTEVVFHLRKGVKFHNKPPVNGRALTSADVKYTFDRILDDKVKSPNKAYYNKIDRMETPDPYTFKVYLKEPFAPFIKYTALTYGFIVPKEAVEKYGDLKKWETTIGSGPFILEKYEPNQQMYYVRNPDYFEKDKPYVDAVQVRLIPQPDLIVAAFRTKQLDICQWMEYEEVRDTVKKNPKMGSLEYFSNSWARLTFASDKPPFNDKRLRQAVSMCIDRKRMLDILYDGRGKVDSVCPTILHWGTLPVDKLGKASKNFQLNTEEAKRLVKAAGYRVPMTINMAFTPAYGTRWVSITETLIGLLNNSGVFQVKLKSKEYGAYISSNYVGKYKDDCFFGYTTPPGDADEALWDLHHSTSRRNSARVKDPHLDKLLEAQRQELKKEKRLAILKEIQYYLGDQIYNMPTISQPGYYIWYPHVKGFSPHIIPAYNIGDRDRLIWLDK